MAGTRKGILLRLDPAVHDALARWAGDELRSTNAQIEFLLRAALQKAGRMPKDVAGIPRRGRPPRDDAAADNTDTPIEGSAGENTVDSRDENPGADTPA